MRAAIWVAVAGLLVAISFGVLAEPVMGEVAPIVMSALVFAGSAQFAATAVLSAGGGAVAAIVAGVLLNAALRTDGDRARALPARRPAAPGGDRRRR